MRRATLACAAAPQDAPEQGCCGLCYPPCPTATVGRGPLCLSKCALGGYDYYSSTGDDRLLLEEDADDAEDTHDVDAADAGKMLRGTK